MSPEPSTLTTRPRRPARLQFHKYLKKCVEDFLSDDLSESKVDAIDVLKNEVVLKVNESSVIKSNDAPKVVHINKMEPFLFAKRLANFLNFD